MHRRSPKTTFPRLSTPLLGSLLLVLPFVAGCGGAETVPVGDPADTEGAETGETATEQTEGGDGETTDTTGDGTQTADAPTAPQTRHEGIQPDSADAVRAALAAASSDGAAFINMVDPEVGVASWDLSENAKGHFCDVSRMPQENALGFTIREEDEWSCDAEMRRCSAVDPHDRSGTVFHFRAGDGQTRWLDTILRYGRRVPRRDSEAIMEFVNGAVGVCALYRTLTGPADELSPEKLGVFQSRFTDRVEDESTREYHCGEDAQRVARERLGTLMQEGAPNLCSRVPTSCTWFDQDEIRVFGTDGAPRSIAYLGLDLRGGRPRLQAQELEVFHQRQRAHRCE